MAEQQQREEVFTGLRGRDGSTAAHIAIPASRALECLNVDGYRMALCRKRGGAIAFSLSGAGLTGVIAAAWRHVPGAADTAAELWLVDAAATPVIARNAAGSWSNPTLKAAIASRPQDVIMITFNGKNFILADTGSARLQVFDPDISTTATRWAGLTTPTAPTGANAGSGTYAASARFYKTAETIQVSGSTRLRSELSSASASVTPSGTGASITVTRASAASPESTHWEVYGSNASAGPYYVLGTVVIGTSTYTDTATYVSPGSFTDGALAPTVGDNTPLTSYKYGIADSARMLFAGGWTAGTAQNRVFVTRPLLSTSSSFYDDEVSGLNSHVDLDEKDSGYITGFGGPIENQIIVFKQNQMWRLIPTGNVDQPYRRKPITKKVGSLRQQTVVVAEDEAGNPTLYWLARQGPYRFGPNGLARLVWDVQDIWDTVNLAASTCVAHGVYHADKRQIWWWVAVGSENEPTTTKLVFDVNLGRLIETGTVRDGWFKHTGDSASARCSVMFATTIGATMSRDLKPYIGQHGAVTRFWQCDTTDATDNGTAFQATVQYPARHFGGLPRRCHVGNPLVLGKVGSHELTATFARDYGAESRTAAVSMAATSDAGTETRIVKRFEAGFTSDASAVTVTIGDAEAVSSGQWEIDALAIPYEPRERV